jgi:hypothetical protein
MKSIYAYRFLFVCFGIMALTSVRTAIPQTQQPTPSHNSSQNLQNQSGTNPSRGAATSNTNNQNTQNSPEGAGSSNQTGQNGQSNQKQPSIDFQKYVDSTLNFIAHDLSNSETTPSNIQYCADISGLSVSGIQLSYRTSSEPRLSLPVGDNNLLCIDKKQWSDQSASFILLSQGDCGAKPSGGDNNGTSASQSNAAARPCAPVALYMNPVASQQSGDFRSSRGESASAPSATKASGSVTATSGSNSIVGHNWVPAVTWSSNGEIIPTQKWFISNHNNSSDQDYYRILIDDKQIIATQANNPLPGFGYFNDNLKSGQDSQIPAQPCRKPIHIEAYKVPADCRNNLPDDQGAVMDISFPQSSSCSSDHQLLDNGITVGSPKIFDTYTLRNMLAATANQLAGISPFNAAAITGSYGNLQGVERDVSYLAAQATTFPSPTVATTLNTPSNSTTTTTPSTGSTQTTVTTTCPTGFVPTIGSGTSGTITCTPVSGSGAGGQLQQSTVNQPAGGSSTTSILNTQGQQVVTTNPSVGATIPTAPASTAFAAPTNTGVSASDMLAEQMQLSSQLTIFQMLLQGASSDQLLVENGRAVAMRGQTTVAFPITLRPPKAYKHAVAEVRILMIPRRVGNTENAKYSIVNLLPSEKTYNVAKITSKQNAFGASVVVEPLNVGVAGGKSRDRLYIAKDTDTVALQYPNEKIDSILSPWPSWLLPWLNNKFMGKNGSLDGDNCTPLLPHQLIDETTNDLKTDEYDFGSAVMFGWQFRPVLGADYVASNMRTVFAQLALPTDTHDETDPDLEVYVQTRWRHYSPSGQITGPSWEATCQWTQLKESLTIYNPIKVKDVQVDDMGSGILRVRAEGDLLSSSVNIRSGSSLIPPQFFDGRRLEFFSTAASILHNGDLEILAEDGTESPLHVEWQPQKQCDLEAASVIAVPHPDGTALVNAIMTRGSDFNPGSVSEGHDGPEDYRILIGSNVYGLQETPFLQLPPQDPCTKANATSPWTCRYTFTAQTSDLKSAQTFLARDIAWDSFGKRGTIQFAPTFTSIASLPVSASSTGRSGDQANTEGACNTPHEPCWFEIKGTDFSRIKLLDGVTPCKQQPCIPGTLSAYTDSKAASNQILSLASASLQQPCGNVAVCVVDDSTLRVAYSGSGQLTTLHLVWQPDSSDPPVDWPLAIKKPTTTVVTADPPVLYVSDSRAVKYSGLNYISFQSATFEGMTILQSSATPSAGDSAALTAGGANSSATKNTLILQIPSSVTAKPGYKEIVVTVTVPVTSNNGGASLGVVKTKSQTINLPLIVVGK